MSKTGNISSGAEGSVNSSGYNASRSSNASSNNLYMSLLKRADLHMQIKIYENGKVTKQVKIITPGNIEILWSDMKQRFLSAYQSLYHSTSDDSPDSRTEYDFRLPENSQTSTPYGGVTSPPLRDTVTCLPPLNSSSGHDLFSTDDNMAQSQESMDVHNMDEMDTQPPLAFTQPPFTSTQRPPLEEVSDDSDTEVQAEDAPEEQCTPEDSVPEPIANSVDIKNSPIKVWGGPIPCTPVLSNDPKLDAFKGTKFIISCCINDKDSQGGIVSYVKADYTRLIESGGGHVVDNVTSNDDPKHTILISDTYSTSRNYLHALLVGIHCVSYEWVDHCIDHQLDQEECSITNIPRKYLLNRGPDLLYPDTMIPHDTYITRPFSRHNIYLQGRAHFKTVWSELIECGGGHPIKRWYQNGQNGVEPTIVVTDGAHKLSRTSRNLGKPVVKEDWLIQCVLRGAFTEPDPFLYST